MGRNVPAGALLIGGGAGLVLVMTFHPTGHQVVDAESARRMSLLVHSLALVAAPIIFLALAGLARWLGPSDLSTAALVSWGFGTVAVMSAGVMSGFVATDLAGRIAGAEPPHGEMYRILLHYTGYVNQGFAKVYVVATSVAMFLWSVAFLRHGRMPRALAWYGLVIALGILTGFLSGLLRLDVHGFGLIVLGQSVWLVWLGVLMVRGLGRVTA